jgi:DNA polymerase-1
LFEHGNPVLKEWGCVGKAVREASALGATFRIAGGTVAINGDAALPPALRGELVELSRRGLLRAFLTGGDDPDIEAVAFADRLGVARMLVETRIDARRAIRQLLHDIHDYDGHVGLDIETAPRLGAPHPTVQFTKDTIPSDRKVAWENKEGLNPYHADIATLQLYAGGQCAYLFRGEAMKIVIGSHWLRRQHLVIHNAGFETAFLMHHTRGYRRPAGRRNGGRIECTMQAQGLLRGVGYYGEGRNLEKAAKDFLGLDVPKELQTSDWGAPILSQGQIAYACTDTILPWRLRPPMSAELHAKGRCDAYELQCGAIPAVADMELRGLGVAREAHAVIIRRWAEELAGARHAYKELTGEAPPSKPADVQVWIERVLAKDPGRLARWPRTPTAELLSTRTAHLQRLADIPSARPVLAIKANEQLLRNFGAEWIAKVSPVTGRLHCHYNIAGTKSGRFSANNPNPQQVPGQKAPEFKHCIVADPGKLLVGCDYNQIEMRAAAWLYDDRALTAVYAEGRDLHTEAVTFIVGVRPDQVTPEQRQKAKALNFGAIFGIGAASLQQYAFANYGAEMTLQEAQNALDRFFNTYRQLKRGLRRNYDVCKARGYIEIGCGRIIEAAWETETDGTLRYTLCANAPVQGICSDALLRAIIWTHARLKAAGIRGGLVACVHDELLLEVHEADAEAARGILQQAMLDAFIETFPGAPTNGVATAQIGRNWAEVK